MSSRERRTESDTDHCLNILRQTVQCNPDLSILPMQWGATYAPGLPTMPVITDSNNRTRLPIGLDEGHHQCVQWDKIDGWMQERSLDVFAPGVIVHPTLGKNYEYPPWLYLAFSL